MARQRHCDGRGYRSGAVATNAHWGFPPNTTGHSRRSSAKPWNPNGKRSLRRIPMAFAPDARGGRPAKPSSTGLPDGPKTCSKLTAPSGSIEHLNTPVNNPPVDDPTEVEVTDPTHPLFGRRFALFSTRPRPYSVGYLFVAYRDTMV